MSITDSASTTSTSYTVVITSNYASATTACGNYSGNFTVTVTMPPPPRRILVKTPKKWGKKACMEWADLINHKTRTGWVVEMILTGEVIVTDPNIEVRDFYDFLELLKWRASEQDKKKIDAFVNKRK